MLKILRKATVSFIMSVHMEHLVSQWRDFLGIWYLWICFRKFFKKSFIKTEQE